MIHSKDLFREIEKSVEKDAFSGSVVVKKGNEILYSEGFGFRNKSEKLPNEVNTRFGIASGCKLFTAIGIGQLVEKGVFSFESPLEELVPIEFPFVNRGVTIHQLLTHTSGIADYFDESIMSDFEELWSDRPVYSLKKPEDFIPMFKHKNMKNEPGQVFHYNNAAFILLGMVIEQQSGMTFTDYIVKEVFEPCHMENAGYFSMDRLPGNTALGYIHLPGKNIWKTNIFSIPIKGGPDGGAYVTGPDMMNFWEGLLGNKLMGEEITKQFLSPHVHVKEGFDYGYGLWINQHGTGKMKYHMMGYDPGVSFHSCFYPAHILTVSICSNESEGAFPIMQRIEKYL